MAKELPPILRQYDRLTAVAVLAILLVSLLYLILAGLQQQKVVEQYDADLELRQPSGTQLTPADLTTDDALLAAVAEPAKSALLAVRADADAPNLFTPARRFLCVKCAYPIPWQAEACPFCKTEQPKEKTIDLSSIDSDGDTMPDQWETAHKLNPQDPNDADLDADNDGFTNLEEFQAKTDPNDPKSHPGYETRMALAGISGEKVPLRAVGKMELPSSKDAAGNTVRHYLITFVSVSQDGKVGTTSLRAKDGDEIGKSGFRFVRYNELPTKRIEVGEHKQARFINVSTIDLERIADGKTIQLTFCDANNPAWPGEPLLEQKAEITIDLPGVQPVTVAPGAVFTVKGETYTVRTVDAEHKLVRIEKNAEKKVFELK